MWLQGLLGERHEWLPDWPNWQESPGETGAEASSGLSSSRSAFSAVCMAPPQVTTGPSLLQRPLLWCSLCLPQSVATRQVNQDDACFEWELEWGRLITLVYQKMCLIMVANSVIPLFCSSNCWWCTESPLKQACLTASVWQATVQSTSHADGALHSKIVLLVLWLPYHAVLSNKFPFRCEDSTEQVAQIKSCHAHPRQPTLKNAQMESTAQRQQCSGGWINSPGHALNLL